MRKIVLFLIAAFVVQGAMAQCTPNPLWVALGLPGIQPSTLVQDSIPDGSENTAYSYNFTVIVPADTTVDLSDLAGLPVPPITVSVDYIEITNVGGLPTGMTYACDTSTCNWIKETNGCIVLQGTPSMAGDYVVDFEARLGFTVPSTVPVIGGTQQSLPIPGQSYDFRVEGTSVGIANLDTDRFSVVQNGPNPFNDFTEIHYNAPKPGTVAMQVTDLQGRVMRTSQHRAVVGRNLIRLSAEGFSPGVYFYTLSNGERSVTHKMIIAD